MDRIGLARIVRCSGLPEHEVTSLYFEFSSVCRTLPGEPGCIPPELWEYLSPCLQLVATLVATTEKSEVEQARQEAVRKFLPRARDTVRHEYDEQRQDGTVEFRLAALMRDPSSSPEQSRDLCREALRLEREERYQSCRKLTTEGLAPCRAIIVDHALTFAHQSMSDMPEQFAPVDLVIRLLDLLHTVRSSPGETDADTVDRIVLGLGNVMFGEELVGEECHG